MKNNFKRTVWPINQLFIFTATSMIIIFFLKYASVIFVPFLISIALAIVLAPLFNYLESKRIPRGVSIVLVILVVLLPFVVFGDYVADEADDFAQNYQEIKAGFFQAIDDILIHFKNIGIVISEDKVHAMLEKSSLTDKIKGLALETQEQFANLFLVFFMVAFMLIESKSFHDKIQKISREYNIDNQLINEILEKIKAYFIIKVKISLITALWVMVVLWYYEIPYYHIWAILAFFLNFIPVIGSILAAIPAIAFAFMDQGVGIAIWIIVWYAVINTIMGNIIEPHIMGKGLGLSPLGIFLSMIFWGWVFGPAGMILSVPLTMVMVYLFEQHKETKWIALLLSEYKN